MMEALELCEKGLKLIEQAREHLRKIKRSCGLRLKRLKQEEDRFKHYRRIVRKKSQSYKWRC